MDKDKTQQLDYILELAGELLGSEAKDWITTPNPFFFDRSPMEAVIGGDGDSVVELLSERLGRV